MAGKNVSEMTYICVEWDIKNLNLVNHSHDQLVKVMDCDVGVVQLSDAPSKQMPHHN